MSGGRTYWLALDARWLAREGVVEAREEVGHAAVTVLLALMGQAKLENDGGRITTGYRSLGREAFLEGGVDEARRVVAACVAAGLLDDHADHEDGRRFTCRLSGWQADQTKGRAASRKATERDGHYPGDEARDDDERPVTDRDESRPVTHGHASVGTGQDRTEEEDLSSASSTVEPAKIEQARQRLQQVTQVFEAWVQSTERDPARTKLTADRKRRIENALKTHGLEQCLDAVRNIGADAWARGANDRGRRFDDIEHALGTPKRIEDWSEKTPAAAANGVDNGRALLNSLIGPSGDGAA